jgi:hypothetical protein
MCAQYIYIYQKSLNKKFIVRCAQLKVYLVKQWSRKVHCLPELTYSLYRVLGHFKWKTKLDERTQFNSQVVLLLCHLRPQHTFSHVKKSQPSLLGLVALAVALPPPSVHEIRLECDMFVTRINFDLRIVHCEPK